MSQPSPKTKSKVLLGYVKEQMWYGLDIGDRMGDMGDIDDILQADSTKGLIDSLADDADNIEALIVAYTRKDGSLCWRSNCRRSEGLGIFMVVHHDLLNDIGDDE